LNLTPYGYSKNAIDHLSNPFLSNEQQIINNSIMNNMANTQDYRSPIITQKVVPQLLKENVAYLRVKFF
jgi:hypothetical protein